jgi:cholinesterase
VLGFPGVPAAETNPGLLDQRAAVEWLRDKYDYPFSQAFFPEHRLTKRNSIENFGGDPKRMVLFGQSAGGMSVDLYAFAYTKDPIVHGLIPQSGTISGSPSRIVSTGSEVPPASVKSWSDLSTALGCGEVTAKELSKTLSCMRSKPSNAVLDATAPKGGVSAMGSWGPKADGKAVMSDVASRAAKGDFIKIVRPFFFIPLAVRQLLICPPIAHPGGKHK